MMNTPRFLLPVGLVGACLLSLLGCGTASTPAPSAVTAASGPAASTAAAATASSAAAPSASTASAPPLIGATCTPTPIKFDAKAPIDLTGAWAGDDGGIYYVRQRGNVIWWNGMSSRDDPPEKLGRDWNNVGRGQIKPDLTIASDWVDVPRGGINGYGTVNFKIGPDAAGNVQITKTSETGTGRGDSVWTRCTPGFAS
jgi:hypothetical protein